MKSKKSEWKYLHYGKKGRVSELLDFMREHNFSLDSEFYVDNGQVIIQGKVIEGEVEEEVEEE